MAASGAGVMQLRSVEFARNHGVPLHVRSTFSEAEGTWIVDEEDPMLEKAIISGVAHTDDASRCSASARSDAASSSRTLADAGVNVDTILQVSSDEIVFTRAARRPDSPASDLLALAGRRVVDRATTSAR